ncbi:MAG: flavodoxin domain-containing protein [Paracoccaceae bacterium]|nr:flavodoxin domain-containing protein [Paracoccaceae bacterium]
MRILIAYATTEGQTRKICRFAADHLSTQGHSVELLNAGDTEGLDVVRFDAVVMAGSVHAGNLQDDLIRFGAENATLLASRPTLYLQVSLSAAGDDASEWEDLRRIAGRVSDAIGFVPGRTEHVAGAFRFTQYDFFKSWAMRWIASQKGEDIDPHADREYTDWAALSATLDEWAASV